MKWMHNPIAKERKIKASLPPSIPAFTSCIWRQTASNGSPLMHAPCIHLILSNRWIQETFEREDDLWNFSSFVILKKSNIQHVWIEVCHFSNQAYCPLCASMEREGFSAFLTFMFCLLWQLCCMNGISELEGRLNPGTTIVFFPFLFHIHMHNRPTYYWLHTQQTQE